MTDDDLARALLAAVRAQDFAATPDGMFAGEPIRRFPSIDLAVIAFAPGATPIAANVLFSRDHPDGIVATPARDFGPIVDVAFVTDQTDAAGESLLWWPQTDWSTRAFVPLGGGGARRVVAPYPASLIKLMVLVGVAHAIDTHRATWGMPWEHQGKALAVRDWAEDMIVVSDNRATTALVSLLHRVKVIERGEHGESRNELNALFARFGLPTLRLTDTRPDGGWTNGAGCGVGHLQMTAWDTARLLWLLDADAAVAPWLAGAEAHARLLSPSSTETIRVMLEDQALHEVLSSTALAGQTDWRRGIPAHVPVRWIAPDGHFAAHSLSHAGDIRPANGAAQVRFAHKTGTTQNYLADAGIVRGLGSARRHYLIALLSNLGTRYAPRDGLATTWRIPALGRAIDDYLITRLEF